ncbi:polyphosphate polymerase domain-containing protein [Paeniglutamicibacter gangotriensis]|uniref:polyphosphate polymerase domain-containing protein n=1 Tax=Paeniglutamicibacter gangotriensis TaxID=254787 RepID=UPI0037CBEE01
MTTTQYSETEVLAGSCAQALAEAADAADPISLEDVVSEAALMTRVDKKFLLNAEQFTELMARLGPSFRIMQIGERRMFTYESVYFDTPDLEMFTAHKQGRRRRYKIRTRTYADSGLCMFEAKFKGLRGQTVKHRIPYDVSERNTINAEAHGFLTEQLSTQYNQELPHLEPVMRSDYIRGTFVNPLDEERLTCDVNLVYTQNGTVVHGPDLFVIETKTADGRGAADSALATMGIRPVSMSKYCIGIALLHPHLAANKWSRLLKQKFGWNRTPRQISR